ncbi:MAG: hypothetical protein Q8O95_00405 [bacterium]|nr:hypothetical protein [bacterium]
MRVTSTTVNYLNSGLILLAAAIAYLLPFELFLFSYAVLGPLHYLTEISWLQKRQYFSPGKHDGTFLILIGVLIFLGASFKDLIGPFVPSFIALAFLLALVMVIVRRPVYKAFSIALILLFLVLFSQARWYIVFFSIFLTTIIHVFVFTAAFMLYGALKERSRSGYLSLGLLLAVALSFFLFVPEGNVFELSKYVQEAFLSAFPVLNIELSRLLPVQELSTVNDLFFSTSGLVVMRFIAFAYTYHYLNWFSKTSIIKWHEVSKKYATGIFFVWLIAVGLYAYDYEVGLTALYFLSMLHVLLEFPLNQVSFIGIGKEIGARLGFKKTPVKA